MIECLLKEYKCNVWGVRFALSMTHPSYRCSMFDIGSDSILCHQAKILSLITVNIVRARACPANRNELKLC